MSTAGNTVSKNTFGWFGVFFFFQRLEQTSRTRRGLTALLDAPLLVAELLWVRCHFGHQGLFLQDLGLLGRRLPL